MKLLCLVAWMLTLTAMPLHAAAPSEPLSPERLNTIIEALSRLEPAVVQGNPKLVEALGKVLDATRGTPRFVELVRRFSVAGREMDLIEVAAKYPAEESGVEAMRLVLGSAAVPDLRPLLRGADKAKAAALVKALANSNHPKAAALLVPLVTETKVDAAVRKEAVRGLARSQEGARQLLAWARADKLPADVRFTASAELNAARWPDVQAEAAKLLPLPAGANAQPLPPIAELLQRKGDSRNGEAVYFREVVGCAKCHQINGRGVEFGPALSEIGSKLGKEAMLEAILEPSAGISFGFEIWNVETKDSSEFTGMVVSDAVDELAIKAVGGVVTRLKKADVVKRTQSKLSGMPTGLAQSVTPQELVDLLEFLSTLKKK